MASWTDALSGLFQGTPQKAPSYTSTTSDVPQWLQDYTVDLFSQQRAVSGLPFLQYQLPRIAQQQQPTQQAYDLIQGDVGSFNPALNTAISGTQNLANTGAYSNIENYMNPYMSNVTDRIAQLGARNLTENLLPGVSDQFIKAGQFGSSGMGEFGARALRDTQEAILGQQGQALQQGYGQALGASAADMARQQSALGQSADLAKLQRGLTAADAASLQSIGTEQQMQQQRGLDVAYQDFLEQRNFPQTQINAMSTTLRGLNPAAVPSTGSNAGYTTTFGNSPLAQIASAYNLASGVGAQQRLPGQ